MSEVVWKSITQISDATHIGKETVREFAKSHEIPNKQVIDERFSKSISITVYDFGAFTAARAELHGISIGQTYRIIHRKRWKHI